MAVRFSHLDGQGGVIRSSASRQLRHWLWYIVLAYSVLTLLQQDTSWWRSLVYGTAASCLINLRFD